MIPSLDEVGFYMRGIWRLARNDPSGMQYLDFSDRGFWRSFWAYFYMLPVYIYSWIEERNRYCIDYPDASAGLGYVLKMVATDIFIAAGFLVILALLSKPLGFAKRFSYWLIASNWAGLALSYILIVPVILGSLLPESVVPGFLMLLVLALMVWAEFRIYRAALAGDVPVTIFIILMEFGWMIAAATLR